MVKVEIDIILPCFNPISNWYTELVSFNQIVKEKFHLNFIIINDGSTIEVNKPEIVKLLPDGTKFISYPVNKGKGYALREGMKVANSEYAIYTDIDFPFTTESALHLIHTLVSDSFDIVVGYRPEAYYEKKMSTFRRILSKAFRFFVKQILKMPVSDTQCGIKGFNRKGKQKFIQTTINRYLFDFEFIYIACKDKNLSLQPVKVELKENVIFSKMKLKIIIQELFNLTRILIFNKFI